MPKCGACGKYLSTNDSIRCGKCKVSYHRTCAVNLPTVKLSSVWQCQACIGTSGGSTQSSPVEMYADTEDIDVGVEIRSFRTELRAMRAELSELRADISGFREAIQSCNTRLNIFEDRLASLEKKQEDIKCSSDIIQGLQQKLNEYEQYNLASDLEVVGVPEIHGESPSHLLGILGSKLGVAIDERDIVFTERIGRVHRNRTESDDVGGVPQRPRTIAVRFARRVVRDNVLRAARVRRTLTSADLEVHGAPPQRVYINERLTSTNRRLFYLAREAAARFKWRYVWTRDGNILARKDTGQAAVLIRSEIDINKYFC